MTTLKRFVVEITMVVDDVGTEETFLFSTSPFATGPADVPANTPVYGYLENPGSFKQELFSGARVTGAIRPAYGNIVLSNHAPVDGEPGVLDHWLDYGLSGSRIVVRWGDEGAQYPSSFATVYIAYAHSMIVDSDKVTIRLRDRLQMLDTPVVTQGFDGSGGLEGFGSVPKPKQFVSSDPGFIPPVLVDSIRQIYFLQSTGTYAHNDWITNSGAEINFFDVFENGVLIERATDYSSAAEIVSTQPDPGTVRFWFGSTSTWNTAWKNGPVYFRLGTPPAGELRCYAQGSITDEDRARANSSGLTFGFSHMALRAGIDLASIDEAFTPLGTVLVDDESTHLDLLAKASLATQAWFGFTRLDTFRSGYLLDAEDNGYYYGVDPTVTSSPSQPTTSLYTFTPDRYSSLRREPVSGMEAPVWQLFVKARKTWPCPVNDGASDTMKDYLTRDPWWATFQGVSDTAKIANPGALVATVEIENSDFPNAFSRQLFLERYFVLYGGRRDYFVLTARMSDATLALEIHDVVTLQSHRFGLSDGRKFRIVSIFINCSSEVPTITFGLWGGQIGDYTGTVSLVSNTGGTGATQNPQIQNGVQSIGDFTQFCYGSIAFSVGGYSVNSIGDFTQSSAAEIAPFASSLLLHFEGTDGSTTIDDSSQYARTLTGNANCCISTTRSKFGSSSLKVTQGNSGGLQIATHADFARTLNQPWTVECWIYHIASENTTASPPIFHWVGVSGPTYDQLNQYSNSPKLAYENEQFGAEEASPVAYSSNQWIHIALTYDGTTLKRWKDGVLDFSWTGNRGAFATGAISIGGSVGGSLDVADTTHFYIDELRFVIGTCIYTGAFTPPTAPFDY